MDGLVQETVPTLRQPVEVSSQVVSGIKWPLGTLHNFNSWALCFLLAELNSGCLWNQPFFFVQILGWMIEMTTTWLPSHLAILWWVGIIPIWLYFRLVKEFQFGQVGWKSPMIFFDDVNQDTKQTQDVHCTSPARKIILERERERS